MFASALRHVPLLHLLLICLLLPWLRVAHSVSEIIDAINAGGEEHVDSNGIRYRPDPLEGKSGIASDFGRRLIIQRVPQVDQILYQTERYSTSDFEYKMKVSREGDYVLVLKFCEVYFNGPAQKVFDVSVNGHTVLRDLDIFSKVGRGTAHDEIIPFTITGGKLKIADEISEYDGLFSVKFKKGTTDNPKINAFYIMRGKPEDVPALLMPIELPEEEIPEKEEAEELVEDLSSHKPKFVSGPKQPSPFVSQDQSTILLPLFITAACVIPVVFCLCKLC